MKHLQTLTLLFLCLCHYLVLHAQVFEPVHWSGERVGDSLRLTAEVDSGWHLMVLAIGDEAVEKEYSGTCVLTLAPDANGKAIVRYNACDDKQCTSPAVFVFPKEAHEDVYVSSEDSNGTSLWWLFLMGLLGGLLAVFTPCVWPVIPMTVSLFLKRGGGLKDAIAFGLSIVVIYVGLGLLVTLLFGASALNAVSTSAPLNLFFFALLVVFALSFFGLFEITLPASWSTRINARARSASGIVSVLFMAFTLVIVSFSCTGPIIGTLLVEAASRSLIAPAVGMLGFALALALPFTLFALFPRWMQQAPRSGEWMQTLKVTLAFVELAFSLKFLSVADMAYGWGILPRWLFLLLWIICAVALAVYLIVKAVRTRQTADATSSRSRLYRCCLYVLALLSAFLAAYLIPGLYGAPVKAVSAFAPPMSIQGQTVFNDYEQGLAYARQENKPVLLHFTGYGCVNCREMEAYVLHNDSVQQLMQQYVCITLYVDSRRDDNHNGVPDGDENSRLQREQYGSNAQPQFVRLTPDRQVLQPYFFFSTDPDAFAQWLNPVQINTVQPFALPEPMDIPTLQEISLPQ